MQAPEELFLVFFVFCLFVLYRKENTQIGVVKKKKEQMEKGLGGKGEEGILSETRILQHEIHFNT